MNDNEGYESDNSIIYSNSDEESDEESENSIICSSSDEESYEESNEENITKYKQCIDFLNKNNTFDFFNKDNTFDEESIVITNIFRELRIYNWYLYKDTCIDNCIISQQSIKQKILNSYEFCTEQSILNEKKELLYIIHRFEKNGVAASKLYTMDSDIVEINMEITNLKKKEGYLKFENNLKSGIYSIDFLKIMLYLCEPFGIFVEKGFINYIRNQENDEDIQNYWQHSKDIYLKSVNNKTIICDEIKNYKHAKDMKKITNLIIELKTKHKIIWE